MVRKAPRGPAPWKVWCPPPKDLAGDLCGMGSGRPRTTPGAERRGLEAAAAARPCTSHRTGPKGKVPGAVVFHEVPDAGPTNPDRCGRDSVLIPCWCAWQVLPWCGTMRGYRTPVGDVYTGGWADGAPSGVGRCEYETGDIYEGEWSRGMWEGRGCFTKPDGTEVCGRFKWNTLEETGADAPEIPGEEPPSVPEEARLPMQGHAFHEFEAGGSFDGMWHMGKPWKGRCEKGGLFLPEVRIGTRGIRLM